MLLPQAICVAQTLTVDMEDSACGYGGHMDEEITVYIGEEQTMEPNWTEGLTVVSVLL
jgi:hypothetical protein